MDEVVLPNSVRLLWDLGGTGTRGPKRTLSLEQILDAAVTVADAEGYAALSMSRIAKELGFTTMSLYRYVDSKDTLAELLLDHVCGLPPELPAADWRAGLEAWAWAEFRMIRARDWWLDIPRSGPPMGPNNMAWLEAGMSAMADAGIPETLSLQLIMNLSMYVIGRADFLRTLSNAEDVDFTAILAQVIDPERFPALNRAITNRAFEDDDIDWEDADFRFGLDRLLDGYEHFIHTMTQ